MPIYEITDGGLAPVSPTTFADEDIKEREDLQQLVKGRIAVLAGELPDVDELMVLSEEFSDWEDSRRRIDLLCLDKDAGLVVVELKRTEDGGHMDLQALRYAAMVSAMTFEQAARAHGAYLRNEAHAEAKGEDVAEDITAHAASSILAFLEWDEPDEDSFAQNVRIVLASAEFSRELTTAVMWLNERDVDIRCVRMRPYKLDGTLLIDVQQIIPLPESVDYQVRIQEKARSERASRAGQRNWDREQFTAEVRRNRGDDAATAVADMLDWAEEHADDIAWGKGAEGSFSPRLDGAANRFAGFMVWTGGTVENQLQQHVKNGPFAEESLRAEWLDRLNALPGVQLPTDAVSARPSFSLPVLLAPAAMQGFKDVYEWVIRTVRDFDQTDDPG